MIREVAQKIRQNPEKIKKWIHEKASNLEIPIYSSFDIRNSNHKTVIVDANAFPAGWNNLCPESKILAVKYIRKYIKNYSKVKKILLISESHTRNTWYLENLYQIKSLLEKAGFKVKSGGFPDIVENSSVELETAQKHKIKLYKILKKNDELIIDDFIPDLIILNNDLSTEIPDELKEIKQPITPSPYLGWFQRTKYRNFKAQEKLLNEFSKLIDVDPWLLFSYFDKVENIDFIKKRNFEKIAEKIDSIIEKTQKKYDEYNIKEKPYVFVKGESGTYGMNVLHFFSGAEFLKLNSKQRRKMAKRKGNKMVDSVIIQEGVQTVDIVDGMLGEPVLYNIGAIPVGGFFRTNENPSKIANLNTRGMNFTADLLCKLWTETLEKNENSNLNEDNLVVYKTLAMIGSVSIGLEIERSKS